MLREILEAITPDNKTVSLATSKSPVTSVDVVKYESGRYGILNFSIKKEVRKFLTDNGFKMDRTTHYPYKTYMTLKELEKELSSLFGIRNGLVEKEFKKI